MDRLTGIYTVHVSVLMYMFLKCLGLSHLDCTTRASATACELHSTIYYVLSLVGVFTIFTQGLHDHWKVLDFFLDFQPLESRSR